MCTGVGWIYHCRGCYTVIVKDTNVSGHTCHEAKRARQRGCCRTGVEYAFFDRVSEELCSLCEIRDRVDRLDASTCCEAESEERMGYCPDDEGGQSGYEEIQEYTPEQLKEWDEWEEEITSDEEDEDEDEEYDCFSGTTYSATTSVSEADEPPDDDDDGEDGGAELQQEKGQVKTEKKKRPPSWTFDGSYLWGRRIWSIWNRPSDKSPGELERMKLLVEYD